jgi:hypothetical protein
MAGINSIGKAVSKLGELRVRELLSQEVRVTEKFDAHRFCIEKHPKSYKIHYYGKNGKTSLSRVDRTVSDLYEAAIDHIESLPYEVKRSLPIRQRFGFSWFPNSSPLVTRYDKKPRNGLVLTDITVRNNKSDVITEVKDSQVYERWADLLRVDYARPVYEGHLTSETVDRLLGSNSLEMLKESEVYTTGFLNESGHEVEALVIETQDGLLKIGEEVEPANAPRSQLFDLLLLDICEHLEEYNLGKVRTASINPDESYIEIVSEVFNDYVNKHGKDFLESGLKKPEFLKKSGEVCRKWVKNPKTLAILESSIDYEYLFTVFLVNLKKPRYKSGLISEGVANAFNAKIEEIDRMTGNDYGFLEFSTILREDLIVPNIPVEKTADSPSGYEKAFSLLTRFFAGERNNQVGEKTVNLVITDARMLTLDSVKEAQRLKKLNGHPVVIVHSDSIGAGYGVDPENIEKVLKDVTAGDQDTFIGYKMVKRPFLKELVDSIRPEYEPMVVSAQRGIEDLELEKESMSCDYHPDLINNIELVKHSGNNRQAAQKAIEDEDLSAFKKTTPTAIHPYWSQVKSSFEQFYYHKKDI